MMRRLKNIFLALALIAFGAALPIALSSVDDETPLTLQEKLAIGIENFTRQLPFGVAKAASLGAGYNFATNGALFVPYTPALNFSGPFSISTLITTSQLTSTTALINIIGNRTTSPGTGFLLFSDTGYNAAYPLQLMVEPTGAAANCGPGAACVRASSVNDGKPHHICAVFNGSNNTRLLIDGVDRDPNINAAVTFTNNTNYWTIGQANFPMILNDIGVYNLELSDAVCRSISTKAKNGQSLYSGPSAKGLVAYYQLSDCAGGVCPDSSGNGTSGSGPSPANSDQTPPVIAISPSTGTQTGNVPLTTTCTDITGCPSVSYYVDSVPLGTATVAPYAVTWPSANYADGPHVIKASATNASGVPGSNQVTLTTSNGVTNKTTLISGAGNDSTCAPGGTACATMQKANSFIYHGGDSILFDHANPISVASITIGATNSTALILAGPNAVMGNGNTSITQNVFGAGSGYPLTVGTYNGTSTCIPLGGTSTNCATVTLSGNSMAAGAPMVGVVNLSYVTVQNLKLVGTGQAQAAAQGFGIGFFSTSGVNGIGVNIQNNEVVDFHLGIADFAIANMANDYSHFGSPCGVMIQNNYSYGSTISSHINGIQTLNVTSCAGSAVAVTIQSNYTNNTGGTGVAGVGDGSGIALTNDGFNLIDQFNVTSNGGYNNNNCGGPYGNWVYQQHTVTQKANEAFGFGPLLGGCDNGAFDIDHDNSNITLEYNYSHNTWGPGLAMLDTADRVGEAIGGHIIRYNIFENGGYQTHDGSGAMVGADWAGSGTPTHFHNNNIWNGHNGLADPFFPASTTNVYALGMQPSYFPAVGTVLANNIIVSNSVNFGATGNFITYSQFGPGNLNAYVSWRNNAYYNIGSNSTVGWREVNGGPGGNGGPFLTTLATWAAAVGSSGEIQSNPTFASPGGGQNVACFTLGSGNPAGCTTSTLPGYQLTNPGSSAFIGTGLNLTTAFGINPGTIDFYGGTLGNGVGTGYNIGADGAHH